MLDALCHWSLAACLAASPVMLGLAWHAPVTDREPTHRDVLDSTLTPLMRAAQRDDVAEIRRLLAEPAARSGIDQAARRAALTVARAYEQDGATALLERSVESPCPSPAAVP